MFNQSRQNRRFSSPTRTNINQIDETGRMELPPNWIRNVSENVERGRPYYVNTLTNQSQWNFPDPEEDESEQDKSEQDESEEDESDESDESEEDERELVFRSLEDEIEDEEEHQREEELRLLEVELRRLEEARQFLEFSNQPLIRNEENVLGRIRNNRFVPANDFERQEHEQREREQHEQLRREQHERLDRELGVGFGDWRNEVVDETRCPAINAIPQPPLCWDARMRRTYHPDRNFGCPRIANHLFQRYQNLNLPERCPPE